jgi:uncharacterized protein (DUF849 family)
MHGDSGQMGELAVATRIRRVKACLNGQRSPAEHAALPVTPAQLATAAAAAVAAGAEAVHIHPRDRDGHQSLHAADVGAAVAAIRAAIPATPIGVTTGLWITKDPVARRDDIAEWADLADERRPDFASVNLSEPGWQELSAVLNEAGISAEAGVWSESDAELAAEPGPTDWLRILVEISRTPVAEARTRADEILARLRAVGVTAPIVLHGEGESCWPLVTHAGLLGLATRIGLEDVLTGPRGEPVADNAELVRLALVEWTVAPSG